MPFGGKDLMVIPFLIHNFRFVYPNLSFDRLYKMMEFNVLNNIHIIKTEFREFIDKHGINLS